MNGERKNLIKLTNCIYRGTQAYLNEVLGKYNLGSGTYPYLLMLARNEGINQNQISKELDVDKAMSARVIKKMIDIGYIRKETDQNDSRAYKLFLTEKARLVIPDIKMELRKWNDLITQNLSEQEKDVILDLLEIVLKDTKKYRNRES
ncbi:MAG TPA: MarR family transcriptional regulator [Mobilitalea sp.]|nr:MarR family transcriptional regulator [Mobilitalea sp.]